LMSSNYSHAPNNIIWVNLEVRVLGMIYYLLIITKT
jgi:hypothetical protein